MPKISEDKALFKVVSIGLFFIAGLLFSELLITYGEVEYLRQKIDDQRLDIEELLSSETTCLIENNVGDLAQFKNCIVERDYI